MIKDIVRRFHIAYLQLRAQKISPISTQAPTLIIAPHPDDEVFGCAGLISQLVRDGFPPHIALLTGGGASLRGHSHIAESEVAQQRRQLTLKSAEILGLPAKNVHFLDFKDGSIASRPTSEMQNLQQLISDINPSTILVPHNGEGWPDHLAARQIGIELANSANCQVYEYCVWMWFYNVWKLDWHNAQAVHLTKQQHEQKLAAVNTYQTALSPNGTPWIGILPKLFVAANTSPLELYFQLNPKTKG